MTLLYCYGITATKDITGYGFSELFTIPFMEIHAVVSTVDEGEFCQEQVDKNVLNITWLTQNAPVHEKVVTQILDSYDILPMKFCTIFKDEVQVKKMLEEKYADVRYFLKHTSGKAEMSLKVYINMEKIKERVKLDSVEIIELLKEAESKTPGQAYFIEQKANLLLSDKVQEKIRWEKLMLVDQLGKQVEVKQNEPLKRRVTGKAVGMEMVLNMALLLEKSKVADVKVWLDEYLQGSLYLAELSGPFAPYNFIK